MKQDKQDTFIAGDFSSRKLIDMGCENLTAVVAHIVPAQIVGQNYDNIRRRFGGLCPPCSGRNNGDK